LDLKASASDQCEEEGGQGQQDRAHGDLVAGLDERTIPVSNACGHYTSVRGKAAEIKCQVVERGGMRLAE
jgi:hypothetical protein